ncbi:MAG: hypothetical protein F7C35_01535 [Desulfurococcales archaeon]|nr:hypothetical protein [Desulfurococcales archaeon]
MEKDAYNHDLNNAIQALTEYIATGDPIKSGIAERLTGVIPVDLFIGRDEWRDTWSTSLHHGTVNIDLTKRRMTGTLIPLPGARPLYWATTNN